MDRPSETNKTLFKLVNNIVNGTTPDLNVNDPNSDINDYWAINHFNNYTNN